MKNLTHTERQARAAAKNDELRALLADPSVRARLATHLHPLAARDELFAKMSLLDYADHIMTSTMSGNAAKAKLLKLVKGMSDANP